MLRTVLSTVLSLAALFALPARGADVEIRAVEVGFDGAYKAGNWTRLILQIESSETLPDSVVVETETSDAAGSLAVRTSGPVAISREGDASQVATVFQAGRLGSDVVVRLRTAEGELLAERRFRPGSDILPAALAKGESLWAIAFDKPDSTDEGLLPVPPGVVGAALGSPLPTERLAYASADVLIVRGDLAPAGDQVDAIRDWVAGGGHLAIALGRFTDEYRGGPLAEWVPIEVGETVQLRDLVTIENYSGSERRLPARERVQAAQIDGAAQVLLESSGDTIIARSPHGFGQVTLFAIDLDDRPFSEWAGLPGLIRRSLQSDNVETDRGRRRKVAEVTDLGTQLLRIEDQFTGVSRPSVGLALVLLLIYAAIVGPLDYLFVHRVLRRPALTWITLPLLVAVAGWGLHRAATAANGTRSLRNELHVIDLDVETNTLRGRSGLTLYAADPTRVDVAVTPSISGKADAAGAIAHLAWTAPPEENFGGTYRDAAGGLFHPQFTFLPPGDTARARGVPLLVGASRWFTAEWQNSGQSSLVESDLVSRGRGRLEGTLTHHFQKPITDYVVVFGGRIFLPRESEWHPNEPIHVGSAAFEAGDLDSFLTRRVASQIERKRGESGSDFIVTETAYDPLGTDLDALMRMLTFHEAAGGRSYTGLSNTLLSHSDLTSLMRLGRVIVVGRIEFSPATVSVTQGEDAPFETDRQTTFVRLVIPAERADVGPLRALPPADPHAVENQQRSSPPE